MTDLEQQLLDTLKAEGRLPIARFELRNSKERDIASTALNYVWITDVADLMELVKARGAALQHLAEEKLIAIDYALVVTAASDYKIYADSAIYALLCSMVEDGKSKSGFLFDTPAIKRGEVKLTEKGKKLCR
ncbi:hypothetical protein [Hydrogenoanaerobacterium sp.]|uniref:hypothetical protein n=1 Tax=Hydrogenoanaerobacterium sp. TaxID=2953763 RepID=UPI002899B160|nr:hypothetical protein [Hydrogenoanaerobacterium sp.]